MGFLIPGSLVRVQPGVLKSTGKPVLFSFQMRGSFVGPASILKNPQIRTGSIEVILRERLAVARVTKMKVTWQKFSATGTPPMTAQEIEAEMNAYRAERRRATGA